MGIWHLSLVASTKENAENIESYAKEFNDYTEANVISFAYLRLWMVMVCCQRGRRGDVWEKGWEKEGDVQNTYCLESNVPLCRVNALLGTLLYVSVLVFLSEILFLSKQYTNRYNYGK